MPRLLLLLLAGMIGGAMLITPESHSARQKSPTAVGPRRPIALALVDDGRRLLVANRDSGTIAIFDTENHKKLSEHKVGRRLSHMCVVPNTNLLLATDEQANELVVLERDENLLPELGRLKTPTTPVTVAVNDEGSLVTVAGLWSRQLMICDLNATVRHFRKQDKVSSPIVIDLPFAPRKQLHIAEHSKLIVADAFGGELALIDMRRKQLESVRGLAVHNIRGLALDRHGKSVLLTHQILFSNGHPTPGDIRTGNLIVNRVRRLVLSNVIKPAGYLTRDEEHYTVGDIESGAGDPAEVCQANDGAVLVTLAGVHELAIGVTRKAMWTRLAVGKRPTALAVDHARRRAYVANTFSDSVSVVDLKENKVVAEFGFGERPKLRPEDRGEMLFFDAKLSLDGWYSCHSCHTDGHSNGLLNDNFTDGSFGTPKRVLSLLGVKDTAKWAWNGRMSDLESQVRQSLKSTMQGPTPKETHVNDLTAFLRTLSPPPSVATARRTLKSQAVERGRKLFEEHRCVSCHKPPAFTSPKSFDVGLRDEAGNSRFNPPSLRGISQAGPYFHDNRARSLEEVLGKFQHRLPNDMPQIDIDDLLQYLGSL